MLRWHLLIWGFIYAEILSLVSHAFMHIFGEDINFLTSDNISAVSFVGKPRFYNLQFLEFFDLALASCPAYFCSKYFTTCLPQLVVNYLLKFY